MIGSVITSKRNVLKGHPVESLVLQAPDTNKWIFSVTPNGELKSFSGASGSNTDVKVSGGSDMSGEASLGVSNDGEIQVKIGGDLSGTAILNDDFRIRSSDGIIYKLTISSSDEVALTQV